MQLNPYLSFNGNCEAAFKFYQKCLGGEIVSTMTYGKSPMADKTPPGWHDKIMHIRLVVDGKILMGADAPPNMYSKPQGITITYGCEKPEDAERVFKALSENGEVKMPIQETFWAKRFGMFIDQFDIPWMVNCEKGQ